MTWVPSISVVTNTGRDGSDTGIAERGQRAGCLIDAECRNAVAIVLRHHTADGRIAGAAVTPRNVEVFTRWMLPGFLHVSGQCHRGAPREGGAGGIEIVFGEFGTDSRIEDCFRGHDSCSEHHDEGGKDHTIQMG